MVGSASGDPVGQQVSVLVHRAGKGTDANDVFFDLDHLGDCSYGSFADHQPGPFADQCRVLSLV